MFIIEEMSGFLLSENGWRFPCSQPDPPRLPLSRSHFLLSGLSHSVFVFCVICIGLLPGQFLWSAFLSLLSRSDPLAFVRLYTQFIVVMSLFLSLLYYPLTHLLFIWAPHDWAEKSCWLGPSRGRAETHLLGYYCWWTRVKWCLRGSGCAIYHSASRVFTGVHSCMGACEKISDLLSFAGDVCLLIINAHRSGMLVRQPPPNLHTRAAALSVMSCQSLLGLAFLLARGLDPLSVELNSGPPPPSPALVFQKAVNKKQRQTGRERQGPFMIAVSLY